MSAQAKPDRRRKKRNRPKRDQRHSPELSSYMRGKPMTAYRRYLEAQLANTI